MISIKKHLDGSPEPVNIMENYLQIIEEILDLSRDRMPSHGSNRETAVKFSAWVASLREQTSAKGVDGCRSEIVCILNERWDGMESYLKEREDELTAIIALLAETAAKLDESNRDYYRNLHRSVETLKAVGEIDDISVLRRTLSAHLKKLKDTVSRQETVSRQTISDLQGELDRARSEAQAIGRLVSSTPLSPFPTRRHAENYLADLLERQQPFAFAMVRVEKLDAVARRYGDEEAEEMLRAFSQVLRDELPEAANLYAWEDAAFVAVTDRMESSEFGDYLARLADQLRSKPLEIGEGVRKPAPIEPTYAVRDAGDNPDAAEIIGVIDRFCRTR